MGKTIGHLPVISEVTVCVSCWSVVFRGFKNYVHSEADFCGCELRGSVRAPIILAMNSFEAHPDEKHVTIVGVGLIGGSIAAAIRKHLPSCRLTGAGRSESRLKMACEAGLIDGWTTTFSRETLHSGGLAIVCLPVDQIAETIRQLSLLQVPGAVITDAGSVKSEIYRQLNRFQPVPENYIGSHPIAGGEQAGFEHARANLFEEKVCVVTPENAAEDQVRRVAAFWNRIGSRVFQMTADDHDRILALTSHLPHVLAVAAASCVSVDQLVFTGSGFRDTTRIAEGSPEVWTSILTDNGRHLLPAIQAAQQVLNRLSAAIETHDSDSLSMMLRQAAELRGMLRVGARTDHQ